MTSALDQIVAEEILKLLLRLQKELDVSYLFITHDLATVRAIADEIVVMHQGRVVESGPATEVLTPPHHAYTENCCCPRSRRWTRTGSRACSNNDLPDRLPAERGRSPITLLHMHTMEGTLMHYGFIGLGNLGGHLAASLLGAGFKVTVHDKDRASADRLVGLGATWADSPEALAGDCDAVLTCLPSPKVSELVLGQILQDREAGVHVDRNVDARPRRDPAPGRHCRPKRA